MRVLTIAELMRLTCIELADLLIRITNALPHLAAGSAERQIAQINLRNVRSALARERAAIPLETDPTMPNPGGPIKSRTVNDSRCYSVMERDLPPVSGVVVHQDDTCAPE